MSIKHKNRIIGAVSCRIKMIAWTVSKQINILYGLTYHMSMYIKMQ